MRGFTDLNDTDPAYVGEILTGIKPLEQSAFAQVFSPKGFEEIDGQMEGSVPYIPSNWTLLSEHQSAKNKVGMNDPPDVFDMDLSSASFRFDGKYSKEGRIGIAKANTLSRLENQEDLIEMLGQLAMGLIASAFDVDAATVLQSTTLNATQGAANVWSSKANATPLVDFDNAVDIAGNPDICWLGVDRFRELAALEPFLVVEGHGFSGADARASRGAVVSELQRRYGFERVVIDGQVWSNANAPDATISKSRVFDGTVWIGHSDHMVVVERTDLRDQMSETNRKEGYHSVWSQSVLDIARAETNRGVAITGT